MIKLYSAAAMLLTVFFSSVLLQTSDGSLEGTSDEVAETNTIESISLQHRITGFVHPMIDSFSSDRAEAAEMELRLRSNPSVTDTYVADIKILLSGASQPIEESVSIVCESYCSEEQFIEKVVHQVGVTLAQLNQQMEAIGPANNSQSSISASDSTDDRSSWRNWNSVQWIGAGATGLGVVSLGVGSALWIRKDKITKEPTPGGGGFDIKTNSTHGYGIALVATGGLLVAGGITTWIIGHRKNKTGSSQYTQVIAPWYSHVGQGAGGLAWQGSF